MSARRRHRRTGRRTGRPSKRTEAIVEEVLARFAEGEPYTRIFSDPHLPDRVTWYRWVASDPELAARERWAKSLAADAAVDEMVQIADTAQKRKEPPGVTAHRLAVRRYRAAHFLPERYGDRVEHAVGETTGKTLADVLVAARAVRQAQRHPD